MTIQEAALDIQQLRDNAGAVRAYLNSCMHRGTKLKRGEGSAPNLRCPFHGWTW